MNVRGVGVRARPAGRGAGLQRTAEMPVEVIAVAVTELQLGAVAEVDFVIAAEPGLKLAHVIDVDDGRALYALKLARVELRLKAADRLPEEIFFLSHVQRDVVTLGLDPLDLFSAEKKNAPVGFNNQALDVRRAGLVLFQ